MADGVPVLAISGHDENVFGERALLAGARGYLAKGAGAEKIVPAIRTILSGQIYRPDEFKQRLADDLDRFAEAFVEQLATYALRRVMTIDESAQIHAIATASKSDDYRLRTVIETFVLSDLFQKR